MSDWRAIEPQSPHNFRRYSVVRLPRSRGVSTSQKYSYPMVINNCRCWNKKGWNPTTIFIAQWRWGKEFFSLLGIQKTWHKLLRQIQKRPVEKDAGKSPSPVILFFLTPKGYPLKKSAATDSLRHRAGLIQASFLEVGREQPGQRIADSYQQGAFVHLGKRGFP